MWVRMSTASIENGIRQPYFSVVAKDTSVEKEQEFLQVTEEVLKKLVKDGFDEKALLAGINYYEFKYREADFGSYPKGLMYGLQVLDSWLYDDRLPFIHIEANETFAELRGKVKTGYFEGLVQKYLLDNTHRSVVILQPKLGLLEEQEQKQREKMAQVKAAMSPEEIENVERKNAGIRIVFKEPTYIGKMKLCLNTGEWTEYTLFTKRENAFGVETLDVAEDVYWPELEYGYTSIQKKITALSLAVSDSNASIQEIWLYNKVQYNKDRMLITFLALLLLAFL